MAARTEAWTVMRVVSDCSPVAMVTTGWRGEEGGDGLGHAHARLGRHAIGAGEDAGERGFRIGDGPAAALHGDARLVDLTGGDAKRAEQRFAIGVVGFGLRPRRLRITSSPMTQREKAADEREPFLERLFDAVERVLGEAAAFQARALETVDLVERAGAEDAQAHVFGFGLVGGGVQRGGDALGKFGRLLVLVGEQQVDGISAAAFRGDPADGGGRGVFGGDDAGGVLREAANLGGGADARFAVVSEAARHDRGGEAGEPDGAARSDAAQSIEIGRHHAQIAAAA